jgi:hypothetical protein
MVALLHVYRVCRQSELDDASYLLMGLSAAGRRGNGKRQSVMGITE